MFLISFSKLSTNSCATLHSELKRLESGKNYLTIKYIYIKHKLYIKIGVFGVKEFKLGT